MLHTKTQSHIILYVTGWTSVNQAVVVRKRARSEQAKKGAAVAHDGRVTGILPTPDGLHWLTAGTDNRLRLWDAQHNYHLLVNYPQTFNSSMKVSATPADQSGHGPVLLFNWEIIGSLTDGS